MKSPLIGAALLTFVCFYAWGMDISSGVMVKPHRNIRYKYDDQGIPTIDIAMIPDNNPFLHINYQHLFVVTDTQIDELFDQGELIVDETFIRLPNDPEEINNLKTLYNQARLNFIQKPHYATRDLPNLIAQEILWEEPTTQTIMHGQKGLDRIKTYSMQKQHGSLYKAIQKRQYTGK